ncbi:MAG: CoA transferase [Blastocatellia bacterium]|nr:CoA transferase [Blastocatellia bacterium]
MTEPNLSENHPPKPLRGLTVLEMGQLLAGPFATAFLAWFGAEVIKIEPPGTGDPLRVWRKLHNGTSLWWYAMGRNKKSITLDLRHPKGQEIAHQLAGKVDVLVENFKPGTLEKWGLGFDDLKKANPGLVMARISGWGQTGPKAAKPGYASVAEGFGGLRYLTGYPDRPPVRSNLSLGDTLSGLHAALGVLTALYERHVNQGTGQVVDVAIYESVCNMLESTLSEYDFFGEIRERQGAKLTGIVPTNTYRCKDGKYVIIGGNGDSIFKRLMVAAGRPDMAADPRLADNTGRVTHEKEIDDAISAWTEQHPFEHVFAAMEAVGVPVGPIYNAADMMSDPHYQARNVFESVTLPDGNPVKLPTMAPKLTGTPGGTDWIGPELGAHNEEIYGGRLGFSPAEIEALQQEKII